MPRLLVPVLALTACGALAQAGSAADWMLELTVAGQPIEGMPLAWNREQVHLLGRDGQLWQFAPGEAKDYRKTSSRFRSYSTSELRAMLLAELGRDYQVTGAGHYLVAHPRGQRSEWPDRFDQLYRAFIHYFSVRGLELEEPPCPLIGVVCRNRREFVEYSAARGLPAGHGVLGSYSVESNRIVLYDVGQGTPDADDWQKNALVVIHEATHQTAFNTGIHSRFTMPPVWVAEGLALLFEAPGVYHSRANPRRGDRVNRRQLRQFNELVVPAHRPELLSELVARDRLFRTHSTAAYATAWALTFYLMETQPARYADYLARTAERPPFQRYTEAQRIADFVAVFGDDWRMLEARYLRFISGLK